jgi:hypothetical protein
MRKEIKLISTLRNGDVLADGSTVDNVTYSYGFTVELTNGESFTVREDATVDMMQETNCLYGGMRVGHSYGGNCTAHGCY